jgi:hypothetical protein
VAVATGVNDIPVVFAAVNVVVTTVVAAPDVVDISLSCVVVVDVDFSGVVKFVADCDVSVGVPVVVAVRCDVEFDFILNFVVVVLVFNIVVVVFSSVDDVVKVVITFDTLVDNTVVDVATALFAVDNFAVVVFSCSVDVVKVVITADTLVGNTVVDVVKAIFAVDNPAVVVNSLVCFLSCSFCCSSLFSNPLSFPSSLVFFSFSSVTFFIFPLNSGSSRLSSPSGTCSSSFLSCR